MTDIDTVMSWLEGLSQPDWRDFHSDSEVQNIAKASLELLKEQTKDRKDLLTVVRKRIELAGNTARKERYHYGNEMGDAGWMGYQKGIRDACWTIDDTIAKLDG